MPFASATYRPRRSWPLWKAAFETQETAIAYLQQRVVGLLWGLRRPEDGMALVTRALEWWDEPVWRRRLTPLRVRGLATTVNPRTAAEVSGEALADEALEPEVRRQVEVVHAVHLLRRRPSTSGL